MPIEVYPSITHHDAFPTPKAAYTPLPMLMGGWSSMPATGPARSIDCLPRAYPYHGCGRVLPGGLRNPWAPYSGETYFPASEAAENILQGTRSAYGVANLAGTGASVIVPAGSLGAGFGAGGSVVSGISRVTGRSVPSIGLGGMRNDDGWDGSVGRVHAGFSPDMTSTAGAIPPVNQSSPLASIAFGSIEPRSDDAIARSARCVHCPCSQVCGQWISLPTDGPESPQTNPIDQTQSCGKDRSRVPRVCRVPRMQ